MPISVDHFLEVLHIQESVIDESTIFDQVQKAGFKHLSAHSRDFLTSNPKATAYQRNSLLSEIMKPWNEMITPDVERFWNHLSEQKIPLERKDPLQFALQKNRFRTVEQGIDARNFWSSLKTSASVRRRLSDREIEQIDAIIALDEKNRLYVLQKCLAKKSIAPTLYLKFGECMAYFARCGLFKSYFTNEDVESLHFIWKNFVSPNEAPAQA